MLVIQILLCTGFSNKNGDPGVSSTHINGTAGDLLYLNTNKNNVTTYLEDPKFDYQRMVNFVNALQKFGWGKLKGSPMLSEKFQRVVKKEKVINPKTKKEEIREIKEETLLPHTTHYKKWDDKKKVWSVRHHHHIHLNGLVPNYK